MTEVWFRNPHNYIRELAEVGHGFIAWDRGLLVKRRIDPYKHAEAYFAPREDWRILLVGEQGSAELRKGHSLDSPVGVYPTWDASVEDLSLLEEMMQFPLGDDADACNDPTLEPDVRPVAGQEHRVIITNLPDMKTGPGRALGMKLKELQEDYPECIMHIHGIYSWRVAFGMGFAATDVDPRTNAGKGKVTLPTGKEMIAERTTTCPQWVNLLGMKPIDLTREPRNRCIYNIKSALWAGEHFRENIAFKSAGTAVPDTTSKSALPVTTSTGHHMANPSQKEQRGDKIQCDTCSLQTSCKFYRQGSVCSVPGSEPAELAKFFNTRDSGTILQGMGTLLALQTRRLEKGVAEEEVYGELDPEVTKIANQIFNNAAKLAKLVDPALNSPQVQVNVQQGGAAAVQAATPNQIMSQIMREFERRGIPASDVTPDMVKGLLLEMSGQGAAGELVAGTVIANDV